MGSWFPIFPIIHQLGLYYSDPFIYVSQKCTMESNTDYRQYLGVSVDVGKTEKRNRHHVQLLARFNFAENKVTQVTRNITGAQERLSNEIKEAIKHLVFFN